MAKHRTKKQKMKAEARRMVSIGEHGYSLDAHETSHPKQTIHEPITRTTSSQDHSYVFVELKQTALVITGIIVAQIVLAALIRTGIINLPF